MEEERERGSRSDGQSGIADTFPVFFTYIYRSDGFVSVWDSCNRKRIYQHAKCESSISSIAFNPSGNCLAIASSYTFELGSTSDEDTNSQIVLQTVKPEHVRPKKQRAKK